MQVRGRARRSEFWWTMLLIYVISIVLPPVGWLLNLLAIPLTIRRLHDTGRSGWWWGIGALMLLAFFISFIYDLIMAIAGGESDELYLALFLKFGLYLFIIFIYQIVLFVFCCIDSERHTNKYGASPKYVEVADNTTDANGSAAQDVSSGNVTEEQSQPV
ncbi:MAG: DUF805 domain-containing protein [Prevotellaceae bacterium]|nr:DUF805 domain-containing protein [Prevotellaceae bacterium]